jgi:hypothetical protein
MARLRAAVARKEVMLVNPPDDLTLRRFTRDATSLRAGIELGKRVGAELARTLLQAVPAEAVQGSRGPGIQERADQRDQGA